jgi:tetratricopeptide (TPR) repeat protein
MKNRVCGQINCVFLVVALLGLCGFSDLSIQDVETAIINQDYEQAREIATQLLSDGSVIGQYDEIRYYLALCDLRLGFYEQARKIFTELTKSKNNDVLRDKAYLGMFDTYYVDGQYRKALQSISRLLKISPNSEFLSLIYLKIARANLKLAHWYEAQDYLKKITVNFPESMEVHVAKQLLNEKQYFAVQVGAFIDRQRAEKLTDELQRKGEYAYIVETVDQQNSTFYRVRVGQLVLLDKAEKLKVKLSKEGYPTQIYP